MNEKTTPGKAIYFHGLPGSAAELDLVGISDAQKPRVLDPLDVSAFDQHVKHTGPVQVIGFSLGAFSALKLAAARPDSVSDLVLISPAGALELGPYLDQMAGAPVFKMARSSAIGFAGMTAMQALAAHLVPKFLLRQMFANSCDADRGLLQDAVAIEHLIYGLKNALWTRATLYRRTVAEYVNPWAGLLNDVACPCRIFHGQRDTWAPIEMARLLAESLSGPTELQEAPNLGHYSTLIQVLPRVLGETDRR